MCKSIRGRYVALGKAMTVPPVTGEDIASGSGQVPAAEWHKRSRNTGPADDIR